MTTPIGFVLNPLKYASGLLDVTMGCSSKVNWYSPFMKIENKSGSFRLTPSTAQVHAKKTIVATNRYSNEDLPNVILARYMSVHSSIIVTRPLLQDELTAQNRNSEQMAHDTHNFLHYFRLSPDQWFLFAMSGELFAKNRNRPMINKEI